MNNFGKKLTVYLANGIPSGVRHVEIANWSGQAIACPRSRLKEMADWPESSRPGVYFLFEKHSGDTGDSAYIGESQDVRTRLKDHFRNKDFWNEAVFFTNKDDNLTKAHVLYLEARLSQIGKSSNRYKIEAGKIPTEQNLPRSDRDAMEKFITNIRTVLGVLGHRILETINSGPIAAVGEERRITDIPLTFEIKGLIASGRFTDEGFVLLENSQLSETASESMPGRTKSIRDNWIEEGILEQQKGAYRLVRDETLSSSSYAAAMVAGTSRSGPKSWKDQNGKLLA